MLKLYMLSDFDGMNSTDLLKMRGQETFSWLLCSQNDDYCDFKEKLLAAVGKNFFFHLQLICSRRLIFVPSMLAFSSKSSSWLDSTFLGAQSQNIGGARAPSSPLPWK